MRTTTAKHSYAYATLSGAMSKRAAFTTYINSQHRDPSQGSYRLEQTDTMKVILAEVRAELELTNAIRTERQQVAKQSLTQLTSLLTDTSLQTVKERLDVLRMAKNILPTLSDILAPPPMDSTQTYKQPARLDRTKVIY